MSNRFGSLAPPPPPPPPPPRPPAAPPPPIPPPPLRSLFRSDKILTSPRWWSACGCEIHTADRLRSTCCAPVSPHRPPPLSSFPPPPPLLPPPLLPFELSPNILQSWPIDPSPASRRMLPPPSNEFPAPAPVSAPGGPSVPRLPPSTLAAAAATGTADCTSAAAGEGGGVADGVAGEEQGETGESLTSMPVTLRYLDGIADPVPRNDTSDSAAPAGVTNGTAPAASSPPSTSCFPHSSLPPPCRGDGDDGASGDEDRRGDRGGEERCCRWEGDQGRGAPGGDRDRERRSC